MKSYTRFFLAIAPVLVAAAIASGCSESVSEPEPQPSDDLARSGGATTVFDATSRAYSLPAPNLSGASLSKHIVGDLAFEATFVTRPAMVNAGLGPVYNNTSCIGCHPRDGRGRPPVGDEGMSSMLFRISVPGVGPNGGPLPAPGFGGQLQDRAVVGTDAEGRVAITYQDVTGTFADGSSYSLRKPTYQIVWSYKPVPAGMMLSPRVAPPVFGLGLLEAVPESAILALADESDRDGDGISGRPNRVWDPRAGRQTLGRFGWKAGAPDLVAQTAGAYNEDMGVTSSLFSVEACHGQTQAGPDEATPDVDDATLDATVHYVRTLGVPARRHLTDAAVKRGETVFREAGCTGCHTASLTTSSGILPELAGQTIRPYTDLLLHDMGEDLADGRPDYLASGREWRTPPLWGIGLTSLINGHANFLHDGRARTLLEAVLWHGGEAERARENVKKLSTDDRNALVKFLESL